MQKFRILAISIAFLLSFLLILGLPACGSTSNHARDTNTLKIGLQTFPETFNPVYSVSETSQAIVNKIYDSLYYLDSHSNIVEGLVQNAVFSEKDNSWFIRFQLKKNIYFSNGHQLTSDDVISTVKLLQDQSFNYSGLEDVKFIGEIEKIDTYRFNVQLKQKRANWKKYFEFKILNTHEIKNVSPQEFKRMRPSGTGPYKLILVKEPDKIVLGRNEALQYRKSPDFEAMYPNIEYSLVMYTQLAPWILLKNELDICELQPESAESYNNISNWREHFKILKYKKCGYTYIVFNLKSPKITTNIRNIFYKRFIAEKQISNFVKEKGELVATPFLLGNDFSRKVQETNKTYSPKIIPLKEELTLKILTNGESRMRKELIYFLKQTLEPDRIIVKATLLEYQSFLTAIRAGNYDIAISGYMLDDGNDMKSVFESGSYYNYAGFENPKMDTLLAQGSSELNPEKRHAIYLEAHRLWLEQLPIIPLFNLYYYMGISRKIDVPQDVYTWVDASGDFLFNISQWRTKAYSASRNQKKI